MIQFAEIETGEAWEPFTRDLLTVLGFVIDSPPDRGADQGKDLLVSEVTTGKLANYRFPWLVSCKHLASSGRAVSEADEQNILERVKSFKAEGFLGVYSTLPTANLNARLRRLREEGAIRDYRVLDARWIENHLVRVGYSELVMRYFPEAYKRLRPLHVITGQYEALNCDVCGRDLLEALYDQSHGSIIGFVTEPYRSGNPLHVTNLYRACKGDCDAIMQRRLCVGNRVSGWEDTATLAMPAGYLKFVFGLLNSIRDQRKRFSDEAYEALKAVLFCFGQKVLRETTAEEQDHLSRSMALDDIGL